MSFLQNFSPVGRAERLKRNQRSQSGDGGLASRRRHLEDQWGSECNLKRRNFLGAPDNCGRPEAARQSSNRLKPAAERAESSGRKLRQKVREEKWTKIATRKTGEPVEGKRLMASPNQCGSKLSIHRSIARALG